MTNRSINTKTVVIAAKKPVYTKADLENWRNDAHIQVGKIEKKPTLQELFKTADSCWENEAFKRNTVFKNKDQHYAYLTEYYKEQIEKRTVEEYKKMVFADLMAKIDVAEKILDSEKIAYAAKEHKKQQDLYLQDCQKQVDELKDKNEKVTTDILKTVANTDIENVA